MNVMDALLLLSLWSEFDVYEETLPLPSGKDLADDWNKFKKLRKFVDADDEKKRMQQYIQNCVRIADHNRLYEEGKVPFRVDQNPKFGDMPEEEYRRVTGIEGNSILWQSRCTPPNTTTCSSTTTLLHSTSTTTITTTICRTRVSYAGDNDPTYAHFLPAANCRLPTSVDWRLCGAVTPVRDQGKCGSCWAFAATGVLEAMHSRRLQQPAIPLSAQNLVDCAGGFDCHGCTSGWPTDAFRYVRDNGGLNAEDAYPYEGVDGPKCRFLNTTVAVTDVAIVKCPFADEEAMKNAVATVGPVAVCFDASQWTFQMYKGGIYYDKNCDPKKLNHAVLVVGYGSDGPGLDYWIVKNSWGEKWGEKGYFRLARNVGNHCGIASVASYAMD